MPQVLCDAPAGHAVGAHGPPAQVRLQAARADPVSPVRPRREQHGAWWCSMQRQRSTVPHALRRTPQITAPLYPQDVTGKTNKVRLLALLRAVGACTVADARLVLPADVCGRARVHPSAGVLQQPAAGASDRFRHWLVLVVERPRGLQDAYSRLLDRTPGACCCVCCGVAARASKRRSDLCMLRHRSSRLATTVTCMRRRPHRLPRHSKKRSERACWRCPAWLLVRTTTWTTSSLRHGRPAL